MSCSGSRPSGSPRRRGRTSARTYMYVLAYGVAASEHGLGAIHGLDVPVHVEPDRRRRRRACSSSPAARAVAAARRDDARRMGRVRAGRASPQHPSLPEWPAVRRRCGGRRCSSTTSRGSWTTRTPRSACCGTACGTEAAHRATPGPDLHDAGAPPRRCSRPPPARTPSGGWLSISSTTAARTRSPGAPGPRAAWRSGSGTRRSRRGRPRTRRRTCPDGGGRRAGRGGCAARGSTPHASDGAAAGDERRRLPARALLAVGEPAAALHGAAGGAGEPRLRGGGDLAHVRGHAAVGVRRRAAPRLVRLASTGGALAVPGKRPYALDLADRARIVNGEGRRHGVRGRPARRHEPALLLPGRSTPRGRPSSGTRSAAAPPRRRAWRSGAPRAGVSIDGGLWRRPGSVAPETPFLQLFGEHPEYSRTAPEAVRRGLLGQRGVRRRGPRDERSARGRLSTTAARPGVLGDGARARAHELLRLAAARRCAAGRRRGAPCAAGWARPCAGR